MINAHLLFVVLTKCKHQGYGTFTSLPWHIHIVEVVDSNTFSFFSVVKQTNIPGILYLICISIDVIIITLPLMYGKKRQQKFRPSKDRRSHRIKVTPINAISTQNIRQIIYSNAF